MDMFATNQEVVKAFLFAMELEGNYLTADHFDNVPSLEDCE